MFFSRWVVLTVTWFLAAGLKWGNEAIEQKSPYFHGIAWSIPAAQTVAVLISSKIEGDIYSGVSMRKICFRCLIVACFFPGKYEIVACLFRITYAYKSRSYAGLRILRIVKAVLDRNLFKKIKCFFPSCF